MLILSYNYIENIDISSKAKHFWYGMSSFGKENISTKKIPYEVIGYE